MPQKIIVPLQVFLKNEINKYYKFSQKCKEFFFYFLEENDVQLDIPVPFAKVFWGRHEYNDEYWDWYCKLNTITNLTDYLPINSLNHWKLKKGLRNIMSDTFELKMAEKAYLEYEEIKRRIQTNSKIHQYCSRFEWVRLFEVFRDKEILSRDEILNNIVDDHFRYNLKDCPLTKLGVLNFWLKYDFIREVEKNNFFTLNNSHEYISVLENTRDGISSKSYSYGSVVSSIRYELSKHLQEYAYGIFWDRISMSKDDILNSLPNTISMDNNPFSSFPFEDKKVVFNCLVKYDIIIAELDWFEKEYFNSSKKYIKEDGTLVNASETDLMQYKSLKVNFYRLTWYIKGEVPPSVELQKRIQNKRYRSDHKLWREKNKVKYSWEK